MERSTVGRGSVVGDDLYWYADSGVVYHSSISTGERQFEITVPAAGTVAGEPGHFQRPWGVAIRPGLDPASVH